MIPRPEMRILLDMAPHAKKPVLHDGFPQELISKQAQPFQVSVYEIRGGDQFIPVEITSQAGLVNSGFEYAELRQFDIALKNRSPGVYKITATDASAEKVSTSWRIVIPNLNASAPGYAAPPPIASPAPQQYTAPAPQAPTPQGFAAQPATTLSTLQQAVLAGQLPQWVLQAAQAPGIGLFGNGGFDLMGRAPAQQQPQGASVADAQMTQMAQRLQIEHDARLAAEHQREVERRDAVFQQQQAATTAQIENLRRELEASKQRPATDPNNDMLRQMQQMQEAHRQEMAALTSKQENDRRFEELRRANEAQIAAILQRLDQQPKNDPIVELLKSQAESAREIARMQTDAQKETARTQAEAQRSLLEYVKKDASSEHAMLSSMATGWSQIGAMSTDMAKQYLENTKNMIESMSQGSPSVGAQLGQAAIGVAQEGLGKISDAMKVKALAEERKAHEQTVIQQQQMAAQRDVEIARANAAAAVQMQAQQLQAQAAGLAPAQPPQQLAQAPSNVIPFSGAPQPGAQVAQPQTAQGAPPAPQAPAGPDLSALPFPKEVAALGTHPDTHEGIRRLRVAVSAGLIDPVQAVSIILEADAKSKVDGVVIPCRTLLVEERYPEFLAALLGEGADRQFLLKCVARLRELAATPEAAAGAAAGAESNGANGTPEMSDGEQGEEPDGPTAQA